MGKRLALKGVYGPGLNSKIEKSLQVEKSRIFLPLPSLLHLLPLIT